MTRLHFALILSGQLLTTACVGYIIYDRYVSMSDVTLMKMITLRSFDLGYLCRERALTFEDCRRDLLNDLEKMNAKKEGN